MPSCNRLAYMDEELRDIFLATHECEQKLKPIKQKTLCCLYHYRTPSQMVVSLSSTAGLPAIKQMPPRDAAINAAQGRTS